MARSVVPDRPATGRALRSRDFRPRMCPYFAPWRRPEPLIEPKYVPRRRAAGHAPLCGSALWGIGERMTWVAGLVLAISAFTGWYSGSGEGVDVSVHRLAHRRARQARLLHRARRGGARRAARVRDRAAGRGAGEPGRDRARRALDDLRRSCGRSRSRTSSSSPAAASGSGSAWPPSRGADRRRAAPSIRRAIAIRTPSTAPASTSSG